MALHPEHLYDVVAINAASLSTQLAGLPFSGPIGGVRVALIEGQWVGFPTHPQLADATFDMVVAGRVLEDGDVAIMMVEAESTPSTLRLLADSGSGAVAPTEETVAEGLEAAKPFIKALCEAPAELAPSRRQGDRRVPDLRRLRQDVYDAVAAEVSDELAQALTIAGKQDRETETDRVKALVTEKLGGPVRGPREGDQRGVPGADQEAGPRSGSSATACASTAAAWPTSGSSRPRPACCPGCTARRCSSAARPRCSA